MTASNNTILVCSGCLLALKYNDCRGCCRGKYKVGPKFRPWNHQSKIYRGKHKMYIHTHCRSENARILLGCRQFNQTDRRIHIRPPHKPVRGYVSVKAEPMQTGMEVVLCLSHGHLQLSRIEPEQELLRLPYKHIIVRKLTDYDNMLELSIDAVSSHDHILIQVCDVVALRTWIHIMSMVGIKTEYVPQSIPPKHIIALNTVPLVLWI